MSDHSYETSYSSGYGHLECCPLVVDPLTVTALLGFIAGGTALLNSVITTTIMPTPRKRKRSSTSIDGMIGNKKNFSSYITPSMREKQNFL